MAAIITPPEQVTQKVILDNITWETYQRLLAERGENSKPRYAYDRGRLEIMVSSYGHENLKHIVATLVEVIAEAVGIEDIEGAASTTFDREDLSQGFEPDASFYFRNASRIRGQKQIDLTTDPAPELVIEVDITSPSLNKFPIFAGLGIPEIWRYHQQQLTVFTLAGDTYREQPASDIFPGVTGSALTALIADSQTMKRSNWLRKVREQARNLHSAKLV
jgi:Uma2 family endonuclease